MDRCIRIILYTMYLLLVGGALSLGALALGADGGAETPSALSAPVSRTPYAPSRIITTFTRVHEGQRYRCFSFSVEHVPLATSTRCQPWGIAPDALPIDTELWRLEDGREVVLL